MKQQQVIILSVCGLILLGLGLWYFLSQPATPDDLAKRSMAGSSLQDRQQAALELTMVKGKQVIPQLRRVLAESQEPEVLYPTINSLAYHGDRASLPLLIDYMNHPSELVRNGAYNAVVGFFGGESLPDKIDYQVDDPPESRVKAINHLREYMAEELKKIEAANAKIPGPDATK